MSVRQVPAVTVGPHTESEVLGSITPRLATPPLIIGPAGPCGCGCALTADTSYGFAAVEFAEDKLGRPAFAWQRWFMIHAGELNPDGSPRFRRVLLVVARQSGKTYVVECLSLYWLFVDKIESMLGTSTLTKYAKKPWKGAFDLAVKRKLPMPDRPHMKAIRKTAGEEEWWNDHDCHYAVAASNEEGGRSMSNQRVIADEFAKQHDYGAYSAAYYSMEAHEDAQYFGLTTPDPKGAPFNDLRAAAISYLEGGEGDPTLGLFEYSAAPGSSPTDVHALAAANPTMNRPGGKRGARLLNEARSAAAKGGELLRSFQIETMCMEIDDEDAPIKAADWAACLNVGSLDDLRDRVALCFDVAPSQQHATLYAAAMLPSGEVRVDVVTAWEGAGCPDRAARELPALVAKIKPRAFGWLPGGPAASVGAKLADRGLKGQTLWPPRGVPVAEIRGELTQVCMGFAQLAEAHKLLQSDDPLLNDDVKHALKMERPNGDWAFSRKGRGDCDAIYSAAGAAHLAQTLPPPSGKPRIILPRSARG